MDENTALLVLETQLEIALARERELAEHLSMLDAELSKTRRWLNEHLEGLNRVLAEVNEKLRAERDAADWWRDGPSDESE